MADKLLTSPLNRIPEGLLDFFSIKSMGQYPQNFNPELRGVLDLTRWYADQQCQEGTALFTAIAAAANAPLAIASGNWLNDGQVDFADGAAITVVPQTEIWIVYESSCSWFFSAHAGSVGAFTLVNTRKFASNQSFVVTDGQPQGFTSSSAAIGQGCIVQSTKPFFALPGSQFEVRSNGFSPGAGGSVVPRVSVRIKRLLR